mgnify:CR=1 FL=1
MDILSVLDIIGTFVFAISGSLAAAEKRLDFFGTAFIGFITAVGGGTIRDVILGSYPLGWVENIVYLNAIGLGILCAMLFRKYIITLKRTFSVFDTIGIGVFTVLGLQKALLMGVHPTIAVLMGMVSAVFGGVIRDTLVNEVPLIFHKEIYAMACLSGGVLFMILQHFGVPEPYTTISGVSLVILVRVIAIRYALQMRIWRYEEKK